MMPTDYMQLAMQLAQQAKGYTTPNPMVGAVLVHNDRIIGQGWHHYYGGDHAEVDCLKSVDQADQSLIPESTMYVNLEPCAHYGRTPPCAVRLVQERVKKVVIANTDPFAKVSGRGISILQEAGIAVETGLLAAEGNWLNRRFFCFHTRNRPYIVLKWAQTADHYLAPADGSRMQLTGPESMQLVHLWRTQETGIMIGTNTAVSDNPQLTARLAEGKQPLRIVLDRELRVPVSHKIFDESATTWIVNAHRDEVVGNVSWVKLAFDQTMPERLMGRLHEAGVLSVMVEGGTHLLNSLLAAGLWDEARVFTAPITLGTGIAAPRLQDHVAALQAAPGDDKLEVFTNKNSAYSYAPGMDL